MDARTETDSEKIIWALQEVQHEVMGTLSRPSPSYHHAYAVILEELDELWDEIKKRPTDRDKTTIRREACQVAAAAVRLMVEFGGTT